MLAAETSEKLFFIVIPNEARFLVASLLGMTLILDFSNVSYCYFFEIFVSNSIAGK